MIENGPPYMMKYVCNQRKLLCSFIFIVGSLMFSMGCGGGGSSSSGGNGGGGGGGTGGGGGSTPTISLVTPSQINALAAPSINPIVYGSGFTTASEIEINGTPVNTSFVSSTKLMSSLTGGGIHDPGTYAITISDPTGSSNTFNITIYSPVLGPQPFNALPAFYTGEQSIPTAIATGDLNGDGRADVVFSAGPPGSMISVLFGQPDGTFSAPQYLPSGAWSLAIGDVNGDGFPDIIAGNYPADGSDNQTTSSITVLLNDGTGNFTVGVTQIFSGTFPGPMSFANILGSGREDLVVATINPGVLYLFPNQGDGSFGSPTSIGTLGPHHSFRVVDVNGDGRPDIAYSGINKSSGNENTHILLNQGGGVLDDAVPAAMSNVGGIVTAGDFNNDGRMDLAIEVDTKTTPITLETFLNNGSNTFTEASTITLGPLGSTQYELAVGDFDHDGFLDIAATDGGGVPSNVLVLWGSGTGNFILQPVIGPSGWDVVSGDINGDGTPDLVIPDEVAGATVLLGRAGRTFPQPESIYPPIASGMTVGDVNGDGAPDLLFSGDTIFHLQGCVFLNDGHGNFTLAGRTPEGGNMLGDLNHAGRADLLWFSGDSLTIWPGTGDPNYAGSPIVIQVPENFGGLAGFRVADLDGDGYPELIGPNGIAWNQKNYQFDFQPMTMNGVFAIGDVNNDGRLDLITEDGTFLNQGSHKFTGILDNGLPLVSEYEAVLGDFNGDGKLDVAFGIPFAEPFVTVAYGRGDGTFYVQSVQVASDSNRATGVIAGLAAADFNGDGLADIAAPILFSVDIPIYTSDGSGQFKTSFVATGAGSASILTADFNMDGKSDIAIFDPTSGSPSNAVILFGH